MEILIYSYLNQSLPTNTINGLITSINFKTEIKGTKAWDRNSTRTYCRAMTFPESLEKSLTQHLLILEPPTVYMDVSTLQDKRGISILLIIKYRF